MRLPLLRRPILVALAVGFSVSVAQHSGPCSSVPGAPTLTTEALAVGGDRRIAAVAALLLAALPLLALAAAWRYRQPALAASPTETGLALQAFANQPASRRQTSSPSAASSTSWTRLGLSLTSITNTPRSLALMSTP